jgi:hypothetical protein
MVIIFEGLDKSGKTMLSTLLQSVMPTSLMIRKTYNQNLYPINYSIASEYDWQAILDRVILPNPKATFIADRSFFTQTVYQMCLGVGVHAITESQFNMFENYCKVLKEIPHLVVYCYSAKYELDSMVTNLQVKYNLDKLFIETIEKSGLNHMSIDMDRATMAQKLRMIQDKINTICPPYNMPQ